MLIYLHIPKTGGTTLHSVLSQRYSRDATFRYVGPDAEGAFRQLSQARQQSIKLMRGHFPFGLHKLIDRPSFYLTFLRDPIDRVVSLYYNGIRRPDHKFQRLGLTPDMSLLDFIHSGIAEDRVNNGQTWYLSGGDAVDGASGDERLALARHNIAEHFILAGLTERYDEGLVLLMRELGWQRWPYYYRRNVATNRVPVNAFSAEERVQIEANNRLDQALYEYVKAHFEERIACEGATFQGEVQTFRRKNARYQRLVTPKMHAINLWRRWKTAQE